MEEWKEYRLGDVYDVHNGLSKGRMFFGSGYPFLSFKTVFNNYFLPPALPDLVQSDEKEQNFYDIKRGDVFVTRTSETPEELGMSSVALRDYPLATYNGFTKRLRPKDASTIYPEFIGYYLRSTKFRAVFYGLASSMSTRASLSNGDLLEMRIFLPSLETQKSIATILKCLDDKIELNRKINSNLEEQAKALFKSWFIDFEPFKDEKFVDSELGMIPEGWKVVTIGEVTDNIKEKVGDRDSIKVLSPVSSGHLVLSEEYFSKQVFSSSIAKYIVVKHNEFAYNPARINIGSIGMNEFEFDGCVSPVYVVFRCQSGYEYFFDLYRRTSYFIEEVKKRAIGGVRQTLSYKDLSLIQLIYPPKKVVDAFNFIYISFIHGIHSNNVSNKKLEAIRDTLLPKLMSGEIEVKS